MRTAISMCLLATLTACGGEGEGSSEETANEPANEPATGAEESETAEEPGDEANEEGSATGTEETETADEAAEAGPPYAPVPGSIRFVVLPPEDGLLGSEERTIEGIARDLGSEVLREAPSDAEKAAVEALLSEEGEAARPAEWATAETVVAIAVRGHFVTQRDERRISQGFRGVLVLRGESMTPRYRSRVAHQMPSYNRAGLSLTRSEQWGFVGEFVEMLGEAP